MATSSSVLFPNAGSRLLGDVTGETLSVLDYMAAYPDFATAFNKAMLDAASYVSTTQRGNMAGISILLPAGTYTANSPLVVSVNNIVVYGQGQGNTAILLGTSMPSGQGLFDITASGVQLKDFTIDGQVTSPQRLIYNTLFTTGGGNPMWSTFTQNTSVWVHGVNNFTMTRVTIQHTGGYATLLDATAASINGATITSCLFQNNRPFLMGTFQGTVSVTGSGTTVNYLTGAVQFDPSEMLYSYIWLGGSLTGTPYFIVGCTATTLTLATSAPTTSSIDADNMMFGAWPGGVHYQGDGANYNVSNFTITESTFQRNTGNCVWGHLYAFTLLHQNIRHTSNTFTDCGLDAVETGGVSGGLVNGNSFRRIGYICLDDINPSMPRWVNNHWASGIDTSGIVVGCNYTNNSLISCNGAYIDADGLGQCVVSGNKMRTPRPTDTEYVVDQINTLGWAGRSALGQPSYELGFGMGNTSNTAQGGEGVTISGNSFTNIGGMAIELAAGRNCQITGNNIDCTTTNAMGDYHYPIALTNLNTGAYQRAYGNTVQGNVFTYSPASAAPCIVEWAYNGAFSSGDSNYVYGNTINGNGNAYELYKDPNTSSTTTSVFSSNLSQLASPSSHKVQRVGQGATAALQTSITEGSTTTEHMQLQGYSSAGRATPLLNVSAAASGGVVATGPRTTSVVDDAMVTGKVYGDSFHALTDTTYSDTDANLLPASVALLRYRSSVGYLQQSTSVVSGARVWAPLAGNSVLYLDTAVPSGTFTVTALAPAWTVGALLVVRLTQGGTPYAVPWGTAFKAPPTIPVAANTRNLIMFFGAASGLWEVAAAPILGVGV